MTLYTKRVADQTDHFADAFVLKNVAYGYDVVMTLYDIRKFTSNAILFRETQGMKMDNVMFQHCFQCEFGWNKVKYARITITHVCFIALTLVGSLGRCLDASCSNSYLGTRQMLMHEKTCVIPILKALIRLH